MAAMVRGPRQAPVPRRRAPPGRMPDLPVSGRGEALPEDPREMNMQAPLGTIDGAAEAEEEAVIAQFLLDPKAMPPQLKGTQVLKLRLPRLGMTPYDVGAMWEREWGVRYGSHLKFQLVLDDGKTRPLNPKVDEVPGEPALVKLLGVGSILTSIATAFMQRAGRGCTFLEHDPRAGQPLTEEDKKILGEQLLERAVEEERQVTEQARSLHGLRWNQAKARSELKKLQAEEAPQREEDEKFEQAWEAEERTYRQQEEERKRRLLEEGREEMLAERLMREDEEADFQRRVAEVSKQREERRLRREVWEARVQEFQKMEKELSNLREQGRSEQELPLAERLLRDIAADQQGDVVAQ